MEAKIYNQTGKEESQTAEIPDKVFGVKWNAELVHQVFVSMMANKRKPIAHTKTRGEVSGGGRKPWQQKGTGRARHGSIRSPIWVGGGVAHGPRNDKSYGRKVNKKMKIKALYSVISKKFNDGQVLMVSDINLPSAKTKDAVEVISALSKIKGFSGLSKKQNAAYFVFSELKPETKRGFGNINSAKVDEVRNLNLLDALNYQNLIFVQPNECVKVLENRMTK